MKHLHPGHLADLRRSGLDDQTIDLMGVRSVRPADIDKLSQGGLPKVESVLELPYPTVAGFSRYKLFPAQGDMKYFQKKGTGSHLYILPPVAAVIPDFREPISFVEGEKKCARAVQAGIKALGFGGIWSWDTEELKQIPLGDRAVTVFPDSDTWLRDDLQRAVYAFGRHLEGRGARVSVVMLPQSGTEKIGLDDYLLVNSIDRLHGEKWINLKHPTLSQHKDWHTNWKEKKSEAGTDDSLQGKPLLLREIEPHKEPVNGAELLIDLCREIRRYVVAEPADIVAMALWTVHAHAIDAFDISPFLNLSSPEKRCGKSTTMTVLSRLLQRPLFSGNITPQGVFRCIEAGKPSFLIDEADTFQNLHEEFRGLLNASHLRASAQVIRLVGNDFEPRTFSIWCPKAIALIGRLPDTLDDRSIVINMKRKRKDERSERFSAIEAHPELELLGQKAVRWVADHFDSIRQARPNADGLDNRLYDNWSPLLAVADVASNEWPRWARIAASWFVAKAADAAQTIKVELLIDMAKVMEGTDRMFSEDIAKALADMADRPWPTFGRGKQITQLQIGRIVRAFGVKSGTIRIGDLTAKGYYTQDIVTLRDRYVSSEEASQASQKINDSEISELEAIFVTDESVTNSEEHPYEASRTNGQDEQGFDWTNGAGTMCGFPDRVSVQWLYIKRDRWIKELRSQNGYAQASQ